MKQRIQARVLRFESGNLGDVKAIGEGVFEARFDFGPGYRLYFGQEGKVLVLLLCGGDKGSQVKDILRARGFWKEYREKKMPRRSVDWNKGLAKDLKDPEFARGFILAALEEEGLSPQLVLRKVILAYGLKELAKKYSGKKR
jgi:putative addiction module killer protein